MVVIAMLRLAIMTVMIIVDCFCWVVDNVWCWCNDDADKNDWWFHLTDFPSGHCIVETDNLDKEDIIYASQLVKENSKYKNINKVSVSYLQIKDIKKTKNPGEVKLLKKANKIIL